MAKQRKTRKEKMLHDKRLTTPQEVSSSQLQEPKIFTYNTSSATAPKGPTMETAEYAYLRRDLLKTTLLTISILVVEILLAFVVKI